MKRTGKAAFFIILVLILAFSYTAFFGISDYYGDTQKVYIKGAKDIRWGIDIKGGIEAVFKPDVKDAKITNSNMDAAKEIIETRLLAKNITDSEVYTDYENHQVIVRFPWQSEDNSDDFDPTTVVEELGETAQLHFYNGSDNSTEPFMDGGVVTSATAGYNEQNGYVVQLKLNSEGADKFAAATAKAASDGSSISIYMDDQNISTATCSQAITGGEAIIYGNFDSDSAKELADKITAGSLPFALTVDNSKLQIVSPTLGSRALQVMLIAGVIAFIAICLLMLLKYRMCGFVACFVLLFQVAGIIAFTSGYFGNLNSFTMTIPGIAGIILSIGMGVDVNVIMSERIKEEFYNGKTVDGAIYSGFERGFSAIFDGNATVLIVALVLMGAFGTPDSFLAKAFNFITFNALTSSITGSIFSFGYTLLIGIVFNMVSAYVTNTMLRSISRFKCFRNPWLYGGVKNNED